MILLAPLLVAAVLSRAESPPHCGPTPPEYLIRPGLGVGRLELLMTREEVERILGKPFHTVTIAPYGDSTGRPNPGRVSALYVAEGGKQYLGVAYENGKLEYIEFTSSRFRTADCRSTANPIPKSDWVTMPRRNGHSGLVTVEFGQLSLPWSETPMTYGHLSVGLNPPGAPQIIAEVIDDFPAIRSPAALAWSSARKISERDRDFFLVAVQSTVHWGRIHAEPMVAETVRHELFDGARRDEPLMTFGEDFPGSSSIRVEDLDGDGYPDIIAGYVPGACGSSYTEDIYLYDPVTHGFPLALSGRSPEYDKAKKEIAFTECENCAGTGYTVETYRLEGKTFVKVSEKHGRSDEE